ncbi:hypothetical protein EYS21_02055 [Arthrobacter sp. S39]|nr:hypothetical protein EYS21_02055 [Arthrobacter sp. S39]
MTMVNYRSEFSRSRTGIHGGFRRGSAAAAIGAVLVLTAGVPASQADGSSGADEPEVQVSGSAQLPVVGGLLNSVLGSATASPQPTPVPEATTVSPSPVPAPTTASPSPTTSAAATGTATPVPAPSPLGGTTAAPLQQPAAGQPDAASTAGAAPGVTGGDAGTPAADQPAAGDSAAASAASEPTGSASAPTATTRTGVPQAVGGAAQSRHDMTAQTEPAAETAKVWLGVGLVGSAGAAGLVFTRIRRF